MLAALALAAQLAACSDDARAAGAALPASPLARGLPALVTTPSTVALVAGIDRYELVLTEGGVEQDLIAAGLAARLAEQLIDQLDAAFVGRVDLLVHARPGRRLTLWKSGGRLVAARLEGERGAPLFAAEYRGHDAPRAFYDQAGRAMVGTLLARPVALRRVTSRFGQRFDAFTGAPSTHRGVDYGVPRGTPVVAVGRGHVKAVGVSGSAGRFVKLTHAQGYESWYLHLDVVAPGVVAGAVVEQAEVIGLSGNTGRSTGPHLHYELRVAGIPVDPHATLPLPTVALGPLARLEHVAFMHSLEEIR